MYEDIIFLNFYDPEGEKAMSFIDDNDFAGAINYLMDWWYPGEHERSDDNPMGWDDENVDGKDSDDQDGFILYWNKTAEYVGLIYLEE